MPEIDILLPHGEVPPSGKSLAPRPDGLRGRRVGFLDNELWRSMGILSDELGRLLVAEHGVASVDVLCSGPAHGSHPDDYRERLEQWSAKVDAVVSGLGN
ncbi:MAG: hypothetical protein J4G09_13495 [Proteobacteria bacterium]|nr:hypothetical protein [Pseudomonadota bacterium]